jgi:hypothetical protein
MQVIHVTSPVTCGSDAHCSRFFADRNQICPLFPFTLQSDQSTARLEALETSSHWIRTECVADSLQSRSSQCTVRSLSPWSIPWMPRPPRRHFAGQASRPKSSSGSSNAPSTSCELDDSCGQETHAST